MSYEELTTGVRAPTWRLQGDADLNGTGDADAILGPANGSWTGTAAYVDPPAGKGDGKAFSFASSHIVLTAADSLRPQNDDWSCSFWFRLTSATSGRIVSNGAQFSTRPNLGFDINGSGQLDLFAANGTTNADSTRFLFRSAGGIDWTEWHFVTLAFDRTAGRATLRLDTSPIAPLIGTASGDGVSLTGIVPDFATSTFLGALPNGTTQTAVELYDYRVYDGVALDAADDAALYAGPTASLTSGSITVNSTGLVSDTTVIEDPNNGDLITTYRWEQYISSQWEDAGYTSSSVGPNEWIDSTYGSIYRLVKIVTNNGGSLEINSASFVHVQSVGPGTYRYKVIATNNAGPSEPAYTESIEYNPIIQATIPEAIYIANDLEFQYNNTKQIAEVTGEIMTKITPVSSYAFIKRANQNIPEKTREFTLNKKFKRQRNKRR